MKPSKLSARDMAYISLSAGLLTLSAWISIPVLDISFTMQTFTLFFLLDLLGGRRITLAMAVYLGLGAAGVPVFAGFQGGISALLGITGGYIWGFLATCLMWWLLKPEKHPFAAATAGLLLCYFLGTAWFYLAYTDRAAASLGAVVLKCVVPYLLPDAVKVLLALRLSGRLGTVVKL